MTADGTRLGSTATKASVDFRTLGSVLLAHLCRHVTALTPRVCELHDPPVVPLLHELEGIDAAVRPLGAVVKDVRHPGARERPVHPNLDVSDALVPHLLVGLPYRFDKRIEERPGHGTRVTQAQGSVKPRILVEDDPDGRAVARPHAVEESVDGGADGVLGARRRGVIGLGRGGANQETRREE